MVQTKKFHFILVFILSGCATSKTIVETETRKPSSQICRAECVVQDRGWTPSLYHLMVARSGALEASDFMTLVKQCDQLADNYSKQQPDVNGFAYEGQLYTKVEVIQERHSNSVGLRSIEANTANSCGEK